MPFIERLERLGEHYIVFMKLLMIRLVEIIREQRK